MPAAEQRAVRVLLIDRVPALWGAERVLLELAPRLRERGITLTLGGAPEGPFPEAWKAAGLEHLPMRLPEHRAIRTEGGGRSAGTALRELALALQATAVIGRRARGFDLLHSNQLFAHLETALAGRIFRRPVVIHLHDLVAPGIGARMLTAACRRADVVLVAAAAIAEHQGIAGDAGTHVLHPAFDLRRFCPGPADPLLRAELGAGPDDVLVGLLGRLDPVKGIDVAIRAMHLADEPRLRLVVMGAPFGGSSDYADGLRALGLDLLGEDRIRFVPFREDVVPVLRSLDVLVNASHVEPFGTSVAEAQACGRAVIATDVGGVSEHVEHGVDGLLVPDADPEAMAAALREVADDDRRAQLGVGGLRTVQRQHDIEDAADRLAQIYRILVHHEPVRTG